jgi:hypothetical protein
MCKASEAKGDHQLAKTTARRMTRHGSERQGWLGGSLVGIWIQTPEKGRK